jgi:molybdopterin converting factor small subunit
MKYNKTFRQALQEVLQVKDVASAIRKCKTTIEDAAQLLSKLQSMDPEGGLPSWWNSKLTIASNSMNKLRDYLLVPSMTKEAAHDDSKTKETDKSQDTIRKLENQIQMLKVELENEKNKTVKPEPNPDTGEIPLRTGLANALLDKNAKNKPEPTKMDKKKIKISGKSKVEMNPDVEIGVFSGGKQTPSGNLH